MMLKKQRLSMTEEDAVICMEDWLRRRADDPMAHILLAYVRSNRRQSLTRTTDDVVTDIAERISVALASAIASQNLDNWELDNKLRAAVSYSTVKTALYAGLSSAMHSVTLPISLQAQMETTRIGLFALTRAWAEVRNMTVRNCSHDSPEGEDYQLWWLTTKYVESMPFDERFDKADETLVNLLALVSEYSRDDEARPGHCWLTPSGLLGGDYNRVDWMQAFAEVLRTDVGGFGRMLFLARQLYKRKAPDEKAIQLEEDVGTAISIEEGALSDDDAAIARAELLNRLSECDWDA